MLDWVAEEAVDEFGMYIMMKIKYNIVYTYTYKSVQRSTTKYV